MKRFGKGYRKREEHLNRFLCATFLLGVTNHNLVLYVNLKGWAGSNDSSNFVPPLSVHTGGGRGFMALLQRVRIKFKIDMVCKPNLQYSPPRLHMTHKALIL